MIHLSTQQGNIMNDPIVRLGSESAKHAYEIDAEYTKNDKSQAYTTLHVLANTRTQAGSLAKKAGYSVRSVNMVG